MLAHQLTGEVESITGHAIKPGENQYLCILPRNLGVNGMLVGLFQPRIANAHRGILQRGAIRITRWLGRPDHLYPVL